MITARFSKRFIRGHLKGLYVHESLAFSSVKAADRWLSAISKINSLDYVIEDFYIEKPEILA